jgi:hypothetical protein
MTENLHLREKYQVVPSMPPEQFELIRPDVGVPNDA